MGRLPLGAGSVTAVGAYDGLARGHALVGGAGGDWCGNTSDPESAGLIGRLAVP